jgi:serine/threonine protein kinase
VLKSYDREHVMSDGAKMEHIMNERDVLKRIANPDEHFPLTLNRLVTTTKDDDSLCLVLEHANGIDLVQLIKLLAPKFKFDSNPSVFEHAADCESFLRHLST